MTNQKDTQTKMLTKLVNEEYKYGFHTKINTEEFPIGLNEEIIKEISMKKKEPEVFLKNRLKAYN